MFRTSRISHVVRAEDPSPEPCGDGGRGQRAAQAPIDRQVQGLADEVLVRHGGQNRPAGRRELAESAGDLQGLPGGLAEVMTGINDDTVGPNTVGHGAFGEAGDDADDVGDDIVECGLTGSVRGGRCPPWCRPGPRRSGPPPSWALGRVPSQASLMRSAPWATATRATSARQVSTLITASGRLRRIFAMTSATLSMSWAAETASPRPALGATDVDDLGPDVEGAFDSRNSGRRGVGLGRGGRRRPGSG